MSGPRPLVFNFLILLSAGVWPESESFSDVGMGPIPTRWKGTCQSGVEDDFHCNRFVPTFQLSTVSIDLI